MKFVPLLFIVVITAAVTIATAPAAQAALLVYEGFDSSTAVDGSTIVGFQGDSSVGLGGNFWDSSLGLSSSANWQTSGLTFAPAFPTVDGSVQLVGGGNAGAWIEPEAAMGTSRFMSFLVRFDSTPTSGSTRLGGYDELGTAQAPNQTTASYVVDRFNGTNGQGRLRSSVVDGGTPLTESNEFLVVTHLTGLDGAGGSDDSLSMWAFSLDQWNNINSNSTAFDTPAELNTLTQGMNSNEVWAKLSLAVATDLSLGDVDFVGFVDTAGTVTNYDELRIGSELSDVLFPTSMQVIPEPSSVSLLALAAAVLAGLAYRRRLS